MRRGGKNKKINEELIYDVHMERSNGKTIREIAIIFNIDPTTVHTILNKYPIKEFT